MKALVTGSGRPIGSACVRLLGELDWEIIGIDNNMGTFFRRRQLHNCEHRGAQEGVLAL